MWQELHDREQGGDTCSYFAIVIPEDQKFIVLGAWFSDP